MRDNLVPDLDIDGLAMDELGPALAAAAERIRFDVSELRGTDNGKRWAEIADILETCGRWIDEAANGQPSRGAGVLIPFGTRESSERGMTLIKRCLTPPITAYFVERRGTRYIVNPADRA